MAVMEAIGWTINDELDENPACALLDNGGVWVRTGVLPGTRCGDRPSASRRGPIALMEAKEGCQGEVWEAAGKRIGQ